MPRSICLIEAFGNRDTVSLIQNDQGEYVLTLGRDGVAVRSTVVVPVNLLAMGQAIAAEFPNEPVQPDTVKIPAALEELIALMPPLGSQITAMTRSAMVRGFTGIIDLLYTPAPSAIESWKRGD